MIVLVLGLVIIALQIATLVRVGRSSRRQAPTPPPPTIGTLILVPGPTEPQP